MNHVSLFSRRDHDGNIALHDAVNHSSITQLIIPYVDDMNVMNYEHNTPLLLTVSSESKEREQTVRYLVHAGADVNKEDAYGELMHSFVVSISTLSVFLCVIFCVLFSMCHY